ncbi:MAG: GNAT family N-acetyltransferase [Hyphomicrobiales bacterium]|nr:GNAT family N-acetyltransferase [Hyphomicrobiales bacterium]
MDHANIHGGVMRRLWPSDLPAFREHLLRLDPQSRNDRFAMAVTDEFLINYADRCFGIDDVIYGYFVDGVMRGAGELRGVGLGLNSGSAEAAFSVEQDWRRRGVGTELLGRIVQAARNRGADTLYMSCLARNKAMQGLAKKFEADLQFDADDLTGKLVARTPSATRYWQEWLDDASSFATAMVDLHTRVFSLRNPAQPTPR